MTEPELPDDDELELDQLVDDDVEDPEPEQLGRPDSGRPGGFTRAPEAMAARPPTYARDFRNQILGRTRR